MCVVAGSSVCEVALTHGTYVWLGSAVHLEEAQFYSTKMIKVNLKGAFLSGASMTGVDLTDAKLQEANFPPYTSETGVNFKNVCNLEDSNLTRADFSNSDVGGVDFDGATVVGTKWDGARNLDPKRSMTMGISKKSGTACTFAVFKLPSRKVKTETPSKTMFKHASAVFKSVVGGEGDDESDSSSNHDSDDDSGEESESEDEDEEEEKNGLLSKIADGVKYVVDQLDQIIKEVKDPFYTEKRKELKAGALVADKVLQEVESIKGRARTLDTESVVAQVLHKVLADLAGTPIHICLVIFIHEDPKSRPESGCFSHQR